MDTTALETTLASLNSSQRRRMIAFLFSLEADDNHRKMLAEKIDNNDPARWIKEEDLDRVLGLDQPEK